MNAARQARTWPAALVAALFVAVGAPAGRAAAKQRNIVFVLIDDLRYDTMSFMGHPCVKTPAIDALAAGGVHFKNAFVTTSLCSPSRACYLTGLYAHKHKILSNRDRLDASIPTFPRPLQQAGYKTAFVGKWHMGGMRGPQPGFDYWASFPGQGQYFKNRFNIDGELVNTDEYVTDTITRLSLDWVRKNRDRPFMLYMSHKAVHGPFTPAPRHEGVLAGVQIPLPASIEQTPENHFRRPRWVLEQRNSWHGVGDPWHDGLIVPLTGWLRNYYAAIWAVDDSVGALVETLKELGLFDSTLIIFTSDNGFLWGEHGLIDKRCMYEESIRVPMVVSCPELYGTEGKAIVQMVLNIDVAPTILHAAGLPVPDSMQGASFLDLPNRPDMPWRKAFLYEYFWEQEFPETPTCLGVRTDRYKYVTYHGIWDTNELYDLQGDPGEMHNRLSTSRHKKVTPDPAYQQVYDDLRKQLSEMIDETGARPLPSWTK